VVAPYWDFTTVSVSKCNTCNDIRHNTLKTV
jgi:hypothetical protein